MKVPAPEGKTFEPPGIPAGEGNAMVNQHTSKSNRPRSRMQSLAGLPFPLLAALIVPLFQRLSPESDAVASKGFVGMLLDQENGVLVIPTVLEGSPAEFDRETCY